MLCMSLFCQVGIAVSVNVLLTVSFHCNFCLPLGRFPSIFISTTALLFSISPLLLTRTIPTFYFSWQSLSVQAAIGSTFLPPGSPHFSGVPTDSPPLPIAPSSSPFVFNWHWACFPAVIYIHLTHRKLHIHSFPPTETGVLSPESDRQTFRRSGRDGGRGRDIPGRSNGTHGPRRIREEERRHAHTRDRETHTWGTLLESTNETYCIYCIRLIVVIFSDACLFCRN